jgi:hypothetical protein
MNSALPKYIHALLALFLLAAAAAPACAGLENCSMPCCRPPASHAGDAAHSGPCRTGTEDAPAGVGADCRFEPHQVALPSGSDAGPIFAAAAAALVPDKPIRLCAASPAARRADSSPPDTPLYLRLQALLI